MNKAIYTPDTLDTNKGQTCDKYNDNCRNSNSDSLKIPSDNNLEWT